MYLQSIFICIIYSGAADLYIIKSRDMKITFYLFASFFLSFFFSLEIFAPNQDLHAS